MLRHFLHHLFCNFRKIIYNSTSIRRFFCISFERIVEGKAKSFAVRAVTPHLFFVRLMTVCPSIVEDLCSRFHVLKDRAFANLRVLYNMHRCDGKLRMYSTKTNDYLPLFVVTKVSFKFI